MFALQAVLFSRNTETTIYIEMEWNHRKLCDRLIPNESSPSSQLFVDVEGKELELVLCDYGLDYYRHSW